MTEQRTEVNTGNLSRTAERLYDLVPHLVSAAEKLLASGMELGAMLDGDLRRKLMYTLANDREKFEVLVRTLRRYAEVLEQIATVYTRTESDILGVLRDGKHAENR